MLSIEPLGLAWLPGLPPERDTCAHGGFVIRRAGAVLVDESRASWTLSAAALYLLRSLSADHAGWNTTECMFPCCAFSMYAEDDGARVTIVGCPGGYDARVKHVSGGVILELPPADPLRVGMDEWRRAVVEFADRIDAFHAACAPKRLEDPSDQAGFAAFRSEWARLRRAAAPAHPVR